MLFITVCLCLPDQPVQGDRVERQIEHLSQVIVQLDQIVKRSTEPLLCTSMNLAAIASTPPSPGIELAPQRVDYDGDVIVDGPSMPENTPLAPALRTIDMDGSTLTFDPATVPQLSTVSFADDLSDLFSSWYKSDKLIIAGVAIPLRYWDLVYKPSKGSQSGGAWEKLRSRWHDWKVSLPFP